MDIPPQVRMGHKVLLSQTPPHSAEEVHHLLSASLLEANRQRAAELGSTPKGAQPRPLQDPDCFYRLLDDPELGQLRLSNSYDVYHVDAPLLTPNSRAVVAHRPILKAGNSILDIHHERLSSNRWIT